MRIPPFYKSPACQRFLAGAFIGAIISWFIFLFIFGELQEKQLKLIYKQEQTIKDLNDKLEIWKQDYETLNKKNQKKLKVQEISIHFTNEDELKIDSFTKLNLEEGVKEELKNIMNKNIESVAENKELIIKTIENKTFKIDNQKYKAKVEQLYLFTTLDIYLKLEFGT